MIRQTLLALLLCLVALSQVQAANDPRYHIRPPENWINDPNGPYRDPVTGKIHLYMQYNPWGALWGNMSWYHVTSDDYVTWRREPVAMYNELWYNHWGVYSGGMQNNNFSVPVVVYTCVEDVNVQRQCIANPLKSDVDGKREFNSFVQSPMNPILTEEDVPGLVGYENFRDPTDWWQDPTDSSKWLISFSTRAVTEEGDNAHVAVFRTSDPSFQSGYNFSHFMYTYKYDPDHMFECPDFFQTSSNSDHFLKLSTMPPHRDYIVYGSYELNTSTNEYDFVADDERSFTLMDAGPYYAAKSFYDPIQDRRFYWGWLQEELSDEQMVAQGWSGVQNLMRRVEYDSTEKKLKYAPAPELRGLRLEKVAWDTNIAVNSTPTVTLAAGGAATRYHEIVAKFRVPDATVFNGATYYTADTVPEFGVMIRGDSGFSKYSAVSVKMPVATAAAVTNSAQDTRYSVFKTFVPPAGTECSSECERERWCESWTSVDGSCLLYWKLSERVATDGATSGTVNQALLSFERSQSGTEGWTDELTTRAPFTQVSPNEVELHIFVDDNVVEVYKDGGLEVASGHIYLPDSPDQTGIALYAKNLAGVTANITVYTMGSIWAGEEPPTVVDNFTNSLNALLTTLVD